MDVKSGAAMQICRQANPLLHHVFPRLKKMEMPNLFFWKSTQRSNSCESTLCRHRINTALIAALTATVLSAEAGVPCLAEGEPIQWIADYCMLTMETDDEIAVSGCIEAQAKIRFRNACAGNTHFKKRMCEQTIRNGTRTGTPEQCLKDPGFKGRTVGAQGVGA